MIALNEKQGFLNISFNWLFGLIIGGAVLFLAIYLSVNIWNLGDTQSNTALGKELSILFNPLEAGFEDSMRTSLILPSETRIENDCSTDSSFGEQRLRTTQKTKQGWEQAGYSISSKNRYVFSESLVTGKTLEVFSKPFSFPFKVATLTYLIPDTDHYCFIDAPQDMRKELSQLHLVSYTNVTHESFCAEDDITVCFFGGDCIINVNIAQHRVEKEGETLYFTDDALMYAALFSDPTLYECQVSRLISRAHTLAEIYYDKSTLVQTKNCHSTLPLDSFIGATERIQSSRDLLGLEDTSQEIRRLNDRTDCKLW